MGLIQRNDELRDLIYGQSDNSFPFLLQHLDVLIEFVLLHVHIFVVQEFIVSAKHFSSCDLLSVVIKHINKG